jgi:hypothetical protein
MTARCQFPIGEPGTPGFKFCGAPVERLGCPYCPTCSKIAYRRERRAPRLRKSWRPSVLPNLLNHH